MTSLGIGCLHYSKSLSKVTLPSTLKSIGENTFSDTNIRSLTIPEGVTSIPHRCVDGCIDLIQIQLPSTIQYFGCYSFCRTGITEITIPEGITTLFKAYSMNANHS